MLLALDHVNVRTRHLERMIGFYRDVLGMRQGERPPFSFNGAWMYCGDKPVVHLVEVAVQPDPAGELRLEHFAFSARGLGEFVKRLEGAGVAHDISLLPGMGLRQVGFRDPDGNRMHVDFAATEPLP
jgi:catechol 2,3-dioxygenase-like lactoylglutathione lyase family enzyme